MCVGGGEGVGGMRERARTVKTINWNENLNEENSLLNHQISYLFYIVTNNSLEGIKFLRAF